MFFDRCLRWFLTLCFALLFATNTSAQSVSPPTGDMIPRDVREMYDAGVKYLVKTQADDGSWSGGEGGGGTTALALLAILASGEDPNFGVYSGAIRKGFRALIRLQDGNTGYIGPSMYHHGFAMLALAEAYGAVDDRNLWPSAEQSEKSRSIGQALELAVRRAVSSQKNNPNHAWRYSPDARDADTSVSGAVLVGLLAARNAGIEVPDASIDQAIAFFSSMTSSGGTVGYTGSLEGMGESLARSSIAVLVFSIAKRKDLKQYQSALKYVTSNLEPSNSSWPEYARYYQAQALFQGDVEAWEKWNAALIRKLKTVQAEDGMFRGQLGASNDTSMSLLALALNFRFLPIYER
ncbi:MAG: squalene--hopene cyclase [Pirellulaceae bacterium]|nr:squalene--hopene cyclase [Pirellulaceae bacterium]